jgi:hypothetical protein
MVDELESLVKECRPLNDRYTLLVLDAGVNKEAHLKLPLRVRLLAGDKIKLVCAIVNYNMRPNIIDHCNYTEGSVYRFDKPILAFNGKEMNVLAAILDLLKYNKNPIYENALKEGIAKITEKWPSAFRG